MKTIWRIVVLVVLSQCRLVAQPLANFDYNKPVFELNKEQAANTKRFLRFSVLTGYREGVKPIKGQFNSNFEPHFDSSTGTYRLTMFNLSILELFTGGIIQPLQVILEVKDPSKYLYDPKYGSEKDWLQKNGYCYELCLPQGLVTSMEPIYSDLERLFHIKRHFEKRMVNTLVLVRTSDKEKFKSAGGDPAEDMIHGNYKNSGMGVIGAPFYQNNIMPFADETGYTKPVDIALNVNVQSRDDIPALRKALQAYDLDVKEEARMRDMLVITEIN